MADAVPPDFTPVHLLTGFLGSGKTTLLGRLLRDPALADTAVLINEFGAVGLDHHLVERVDETMVLLGSGCLCCTIRGELAEALRALLRRRDLGQVPPFRRIVVETTGLADPGPVIGTLRADPVLRHHLRLGSVVTTVDAVNGADQLARQPESLAQAAAADCLVVTKTDLAGVSAAEDLEAALRKLNPAAVMIRSNDPDFRIAGVLAEGEACGSAVWRRMLCLPADDEADPEIPARRMTADSLSLVVEQPLDWSAFGLWLSMLLHRHGAAILRVKGILNLEGATAPVAIHGVQHLVHPPVHLPAWPDEQRSSRLVFIVRGLDPAAIRRSLATFQVLAQA